MPFTNIYFVSSGFLPRGFLLYGFSLFIMGFSLTWRVLLLEKRCFLVLARRFVDILLWTFPSWRETFLAKSLRSFILRDLYYGTWVHPCLTIPMTSLSQSTTWLFGAEWPRGFRQGREVSAVVVRLCVLPVTVFG